MITGRQAGLAGQPASLAWLFKVILRFYKKVVSPALPPSCRFYPTCADYALHSVELHGAAKGLVLALRRLSRCHPFNPGGYDPVNQPASPVPRETIEKAHGKKISRIHWHGLGGAVRRYLTYKDAGNGPV